MHTSPPQWAVLITATALSTGSVLAIAAANVIDPPRVEWVATAGAEQIFDRIAAHDDSSVQVQKPDLHLTRQQIASRAQRWVDQRVPYNQEAYTDGYRQDCSGFISMAWGLAGNHWTGELGEFGVKITKDELRTGDILLFHNPADPHNGSHVILFSRWLDSSHTKYIGLETAAGHGAVKRTLPYAYMSNSHDYVPYRYRNIKPSSTLNGAATGAAAPYPGSQHFGRGANSIHVTQLGKMLVEHGEGRFYTEGPGPRWSEADRRATQAFQEAQGWRGADADGIPGPKTWSILSEATRRVEPAVPRTQGRAGRDDVAVDPGSSPCRGAALSHRPRGIRTAVVAPEPATVLAAAPQPVHFA